jgi:hypothetical protein
LLQPSLFLATTGEVFCYMALTGGRCSCNPVQRASTKKKLQRAWIKASTGSGKSFNGKVDKSFNGREKKLQTEGRAVTLRAAAGSMVVLRWTCYDGGGG